MYQLTDKWRVVEGAVIRWSLFIEELAKVSLLTATLPEFLVINLKLAIREDRMES